MKKKFSTLLILGGIFPFIFGCQNQSENFPAENSNIPIEDTTLLWETSKYDYSYLEEEKVTANQYLSINSLSEGDLKQLHDIANIVFGDYLSQITLHWEERNVSLLDDKLFATKEAKNNLYSMLIGDLYDSPGYNEEILKQTPNIRMLPNHIGERNEYVFLPIRVYAPRMGRALYDENGDDDGHTSWYYYVLQLKRSPNEYGWEICYSSSWVGRSITGKITTGAWTIMLNEDDDFSPEKWEPLKSSSLERDYLNGLRSSRVSTSVS
jgi:hypothetical protein